MASYATTNEFYQESGVSTADISETLAQRFLDEATQEIDNITGTKFEPTTITEVYDGFDGIDIYGNRIAKSYLTLSRYPIIGLSAISVNGTAVPSTKVFKYTDRISLTTDAPVTSFGITEQGVSVTYVYGVTDQGEIVRDLCLAMAQYKLVSIPEGRNAVLDASRYESLSGSDIRPESITQKTAEQLKIRIDQLITEISKTIRLF